MLRVNFNPFPTITTERFVLRRLLPSDVDEMFFLNSDETILKYLDRPPAASIKEVIEKIQRIQLLLDTNEGILWAIVPKDETKLIGTITFWRLMKEHYRAEIGYNLYPQHQGKGIMHEALQAVIKYGFTTMNLHSIEANVNPDNAASIKLLERNNFVKEAYFKENYYFNGQFLDSVIYSLIKPNTVL